jgi:hemoglobin-like flavoprotein
MPDLHGNNLEIFQASLQRLQADADFYPSFYRRFINSSEEINRIFAKRDIAQLQKKLKMTLEMVADAAQGKPGLSMYFEMLGKVHKRLNIKPEHFQLWKDSLLETVAERDPGFDEPVLHAWSLVIDDVIERHLVV